jgi:hypothetical protein
MKILDINNKPYKTFLFGIVKGMAAPGLIYVAFNADLQMPKIQSVSANIRPRGTSVWQSVGQDLRTAMRKHEQTAR